MVKVDDQWGVALERKLIGIYLHMSIDFSIAQYNVLAKGLCNSDSFPYSCETALLWDKRKELLINEMVRNHPNIICLEECDQFEFFEKELETQGYRGEFYPRFGKKDGIAIFWDDRVDVQVYTCIRLLAARPHIAVLAFVEVNNTKLLLAVTHLDAAKTEQGERTRLEMIEHLLRKMEEQEPWTAEAIIVGDLNARPTSIEYPALVIPALVSAGYRSAYGLDENSVFTTIKSRSVGGGRKKSRHMIDYIMCKPRLRFASIDALPKEDELPEEGLPSEHQASDHLRLMTHITSS